MSGPRGIEVRDETEGKSLGKTIAEKPVALLLILLMAVGSISLWLVIPVAWIYAASHIVKTTQPTLGPYVMIIFGVPISMFIVGKLLYRLNGVYERVTGQDAEVRVQMPWHRSMRGEREVRRRTTVLELVMMISVSLALLVFAVWFFFFAGSSLPNA
ncbi:MAG: hypothetical protein QOG41_664 [Thermoleophilaceae bacterium]|jgi:uncharacterized RDD family membrane protein YckC|nr:hypothetical protein [Thermoleophilaceae bacterium]MEA2351065.1 hypothetical protein [Thermoleophilaceae bacterium]MEA2368729.1 hypothetical protein [Thermoleophilaceae bacterium]MEA2387891.1 hypothetical protein [Thermoleophilaceae bacterium]